MLAIRDDFDESKNAVNILIEDIYTRDEFTFRTLSEFHDWLHRIVYGNPTGEDDLASPASSE